MARQWRVGPGLPSHECKAPNINSVDGQEAHEPFDPLGALGKPVSVDGYLGLPIPGARGEVFHPRAEADYT